MTSHFLYKELTSLAIEAFYSVYNEMGHGFLEKVYQEAMLIELKDLGLDVKGNVPIKVYYKERLIGRYFADIILESRIVLELKTSSKLQAAHEFQVLNYLKATELEIGMLFNFGVKPDFKRLIFTNH
tara:strand:- start:1099 stop:1479 length:381 start_codon:yes stop_codon:yes gene_type:complete